MSELKEIRHGGKLMAIHLPASYSKMGVEFFTASELSQQMGYMRHPPGTIIKAHYHKPVLRQVVQTNEALFVRRGRIRVDFYSVDNEYILSQVIGPGDVLLLISGGHGFEVLEECEMVEIKQGPYAGDQDKTLITGVDPQAVRLNLAAGNDPGQ